MKRNCPDCKREAVIDDGYCGICRQCTMPPNATEVEPLTTLLDKTGEYVNKLTPSPSQQPVTDVELGLSIHCLEAQLKNNPYIDHDCIGIVLNAARQLPQLRVENERLRKELLEVQTPLMLNEPDLLVLEQKLTTLQTKTQEVLEKVVEYLDSIENGFIPCKECGNNVMLDAVSGTQKTLTLIANSGLLKENQPK